MRKILIRQILALTLLALVGPALKAQFQNLYDYTSGGVKYGGIFSDVQCIEPVIATGEAIVAIGSDNRVPVKGMLAFHNVAGGPMAYYRFSNPSGLAGHDVVGEALTITPNSRKFVACYFDPVDMASDIVCTNVTGGVLWKVRLPNFHVRDVVTGPGGMPLLPDRIWLTGYSTTTAAGPNAAVVGFNDIGGFIFFKEYVLKGQYVNSMGFEIDFNPNTNNLTVAGKASRNMCPDGILVLRLSATGTVIWDHVYHHANCVTDMKGKALLRTPVTFNNYTIAFEHKDPANPNNVFPGLMEITPGGAINYIHYTTGAGFFNGTGFSVDGMDTDQQTYLISGSFTNGLNGQISGYTLNAGVGGGRSVQFNEYETASYYTAAETRLVDIDYFSRIGQYLVGGHFRAPNGLATWPIWPSNRAFWLVDANPNGSSECSTNDTPTDHHVDSTYYSPPFDTIVHDTARCPLVKDTVVSGYFHECTPPVPGAKMGSTEHSPNAPTFAYLEGLGQIRAQIPAATKGNVDVTLVDVQGRLLARLSLPAGTHTMDASQWSPGVYFIQYQGEGIAAGVQKIAIR